MSPAAHPLVSLPDTSKLVPTHGLALVQCSGSQNKAKYMRMGKGFVRRVDGGGRYKKVGEESNQSALYRCAKLSKTF